MALSSTARILFVGVLTFIAIATYVLIVTHHLRLPEVSLGAQSRGKHLAGSELLHHSAILDFSKYDQDKDSKLNMEEFAALLSAASDQEDKEQQAVAANAAWLAEAARDVVLGAGQKPEGQRQVIDNPKLAEELAKRRAEADRLRKEAEAREHADNVDKAIRVAEEAVAKRKADDEREARVAREKAERDRQRKEKQEREKEKKEQQQQQEGKGDAGQERRQAEETGGGGDGKEDREEREIAAAAAKALAAGGATGGECPELSRDLVARFARENTIMLTVADWKIFGILGINWMRHLAHLKVDYYLVGATDQKTAAFLGGLGKHPCFKFYEDAGHAGANDEYKYGGSHYNAATWRKVVVVSQMVHWGFNVIHSDVDVVWFRDPLPYFLGPALKGADMAVSTDLISTANSVGDEGLERAMHQHVNVNTGVYFVRASPGGRAFMAGWAALRASQSRENDQVGVYRFIRHQRSASVDFDNRVLVLQPTAEEAKQVQEWERAKATNATLAADGSPGFADKPMRLGLLGVHMLLNGYSYYIPRLHEVQKVQPLGIHMTWVPLSKEGKFHRFRDGMLLIDPPEYYDNSELRLLAADIDVPPTPAGFNTWQETEDMIQVHLKSMEYQLKQMYRIMAIAVSLRRTLVWPELQCHCFKNWFMSEQCRIPGDKVTAFPITCALDQVFRPKVLYNWPPLQTSSGPWNFTFKEHSFLHNPRLPPSVLQDQVLVVPATIGDTNTTGFKEVFRATANQTQNFLVQSLKPYENVKLLRLRKVNDLFGGWDDQVLKASFETFVFNITANWCCRDEPYIKKGMPKKVKLLITW